MSNCKQTKQAIVREAFVVEVLCYLIEKSNE